MAGLPSPVWFVVSLLVYIFVALAWKSIVLNWIVGPLWLLLTLHVIPRGIEALVARVRR